MIYSNVLLKPTIRISEEHLLRNKVKLNENIQTTEKLSCHHILDGNEILKQWIEDVKISDYIIKNDKYDILFLLLQGENIVQKYMAMYAYLMCLVKEIYSSKRESQKQVVKYISNNCFRVGIKLYPSLCTRHGAKPNEKEDQFTALRNKIAHPNNIDNNINMVENYINELASIICCAIEDIPS